MMNLLIGAMSALAPVVASLAYEVIEDTSNLPLLNPDFKERTSIKLRLDNGLEIYIISDPGADKSGATLAVDVGAWCDPPEFPGMAHFSEHMLFMGSKAYPGANHFMNELSNWDGQANAFTASDRTVYMFACQTVGFLPLLDAFAHFFIDPMLRQEDVARELHAVDQEFGLHRDNDGRRAWMVFKEMGNQNHPNRLFSTGNAKTLGAIPTYALRNWLKTYYGANRMHLAIYSPLPLTQLIDEVVKAFSPIGIAAGKMPRTIEPLMSERQIGNITYIAPLKQRRSLSLMWELAPDIANNPSKPADFVAYALARGQKRSLHEALKKQKLVDAFRVDVEQRGDKEHLFFVIDLELSEKGLSHIDQVMQTITQAFGSLRKKKGLDALQGEKNQMATLQYQYQGRTNVF
ncbi:MAG: hypothetical protein RL235_190, partial [Chlamydiota bacterium]